LTGWRRRQEVEPPSADSGNEIFFVVANISGDPNGLSYIRGSKGASVRFEFEMGSELVTGANVPNVAQPGARKE
jgi:hypothetical protein